MSWKVYGTAWRHVRLQVLERDAYVCQIKREGCTVRATHVDHIVPMSEGGALLDLDNLRASCASCNLRRNRQRQADLANYALRRDDNSTPSREW